MVWHQNLFEQRSQLSFAKNASGFHVRQEVFQVANTLSQGLHLAQPLVHLLEPVCHMLETLTQPSLQRRLQFLVNSSTHFVKLASVACQQLRQLRLQRLPHFAHAPGIGLAQGLQLQCQGVRQGFLQQAELLPKCVQLNILRPGTLCPLLHQRLLKGRQILCQLLPPGTCRFSDFTPQLAFQSLHLLTGSLLGGGRQLGARSARDDPPKQGTVDQAKQHYEPEQNVIQNSILHNAIVVQKKGPAKRGLSDVERWLITASASP